MGQHGHRRMYKETGLPGWMRLGYSPGRGANPPCVQYLEDANQLDEARKYFTRTGSPGAETAESASEVEELQQQVKELQNQVSQLAKKVS